MSHFQFQTVPNIISGLGSIQELQNVLASKTYRKLLLVTDAGMIKNQLHLPILQILDTLKIEHVIYADVQADPPEQVVLDAANYAKQQNVDVIVGFGGGSSLDVAKVIALLTHPNQTQNLHEMYGVNQVKTARLPLILIPTTAGTGSEVTPISIVTTGETTKMGIVSSVLYADTAGIDAMVHAIEAYTSKHKKNIYTDILAKHALKLLNHNLPKVLKNGNDLEARQNMLFGSMLAGQAFANSPVAAVHALAYPLGGHFHLSHGHTNALVLVEVLKFNAPYAKQYYAELMQWLDPYSNGSTDGLCDLFIDHMQNHLDRSGLTLTLSDLGIEESSLPRLAQDAMLQTRLLQNNPRDMTEAAALAIYQAIY